MNDKMDKKGDANHGNETNTVRREDAESDGLDGEEGRGTRLFFEHTGFDLDHPFGKHAFNGAAYGWGSMLEQLGGLLKTA